MMLQPGSVTRDGPVEGYKKQDSIKHIQPEQRIYASLTVKKFCNDGTFEFPHRLEPGTNYNVQVMLTPRTPVSKEQKNFWCVKFGSVKLQLQISNCSDVPVSVKQSESYRADETGCMIIIDEDKLSSAQSFDFLIEIPKVKNLPDSLFFKLWASSASKIVVPSFVLDHLHIPLHLDYVPLDPDFAEKISVNLSKAIPYNSAFLYVRRLNEDFLSLEGKNGLVLMREEEITAPVDEQLSPAVRIKKKRTPGFILSRIRTYSKLQLNDLITWIESLLDSFGEKLTLIIYDNTDVETPWELVYIKDRGFLGACAQVARWSKVQGRGGNIQCETDEQNRRGTVVSFIDKAQQTNHEHNELQCLKTVSKESIDDVIDWIEEDESIGLVYFACHGQFFAEISEKEVYQTLYSKSDGAVILDSQFWEAECPQGKRLPLAIVNACDSGRLIVDTRGVRFGLPQPFLVNIAENYIGTTGRVDDERASEIGAEILKQLRCEGEMTIGEILRQLRERAAEKVERKNIHKMIRKYGNTNTNEEDKRAVERLLFTFMYVYYGNPNLKLLVSNPKKESTE